MVGERRLLVVLALVGILTSCAPVSPRIEEALPQSAPEVMPGNLPVTATSSQPDATLIPLLTSPVETNPGPELLTPTITAIQQSDAPAGDAAHQGLVAGCLIGTWEVSDMARALSEAWSSSRSSLHLQHSDGQVLYHFSSDGEMTITYQNLSATLAGEVDKQPVTAQQSLDGMATAHYQVDGADSKISLSDFGGEGVRFGLDINGQRLVEGNLPVWQAFSAGLSGGNKQPNQQVTVSHAKADCSSDTLKIQTIDPLSGPEIDLKRVQ